MKRAWIIPVLFVSFSSLSADGGVFPPPGVYIEEPYQYAIIEYEGTEEILHLLINVNSDASSFGWIVPLPSKPTIAEDTFEVFEQIEEMCRPTHSGFGCGGGYYSLDGSGYYRDNVRVLEEGSVGLLSYEIIEADDADTLLIWLERNGYALPDSSDTTTAREVFSDYINKGWVFVAFKVEDIPDNNVNVQPVKFTFTSSDIVYPMKITSLNPDPEYYYYVRVQLHVISDHRVRISEGGGYDTETEYGNKLNAAEYEAVQEHYPLVAAICAEGDFITRIYTEFDRPRDIESDIILVVAGDDGESPNRYAMDMILFPLLPVAFVFAARLRISRRRRRKTAKP